MEMKNIFIFNFSKNDFFPMSNFILPDDFGMQVSFCATSEQNSNTQHDVAANNTLPS
jgi:hypothetical protein